MDMCVRTDQTVDHFEIGMSVRYIPRHLVQGSKWFDSPEVEPGIVTSISNRYVFVRYAKNGQMSKTASATDPRDLLID